MAVCEMLVAARRLVSKYVAERDKVASEGEPLNVAGQQQADAAARAADADADVVPTLLLLLLLPPLRVAPRLGPGAWVDKAHPIPLNLFFLVFSCTRQRPAVLETQDTYVCISNVHIRHVRHTSVSHPQHKTKCARIEFSNEMQNDHVVTQV